MSGAVQSRSTMKMQLHISSLVLCGKRPSAARINRVDASVAAQKNIVSPPRRQPRCDPVLGIAEHCVSGRKATSFCNVSDEKKFSASQEIMRTAKRRHYGSARRIRNTAIMIASQDAAILTLTFA
jgi:hypothetical protein